MMSTFKKYLISESGEKNLHMTHIEDVVLYGGVNGTRNAILTLRNVRDMLAGNSKGKVDITVKADGAPAVFCGQDPSDGKFFVAKKGIFNKDPKIYKTPDDVRADTSGDLSEKLLEALAHLSKIGIKGVLQGDLMFTKSDLKKQTIDGTSYITFQPNTIVYAVPADSDLGRRISAAKIGIVFHTAYTGSSFETMKASYNINLSALKPSKDVWYISAEMKDLSGTATLTAAETQEVTEKLSLAGSIFRKISSSTLKEIESNRAFASKIETYNNTFVRKRERIINTTQHVEGLIAWANKQFDDDVASKKSPKGKADAEARRDEYMKFFSASNKANLALMFDLQNVMVDIKLIIISKLNELSNIKTFLRTRDGFKVTGEEGFVAIDRLRGGALKIVDRMNFSYANFSDEILKGWQR